MRHNQVGAVERDEMVALADGNPRIVDEELLQAAAHPGGYIGHAGFVVGHFAEHPQFDRGVFTAYRRGLDLGQTDRSLRQLQYPWAGIVVRVFFERDKVHAADRTLARFGQIDLWMHRTGPSGRAFFGRGFLGRAAGSRTGYHVTEQAADEQDQQPATDKDANLTVIAFLLIFASNRRRFAPGILPTARVILVCHYFHLHAREKSWNQLWV